MTVVTTCGGDLCDGRDECGWRLRWRLVHASSWQRVCQCGWRLSWWFGGGGGGGGGASVGRARV